MRVLRYKRKASDDLVSLPPPKRATTKNNASAQQPSNLNLSSPPRRTQKQPVRQSSPISVTSSASESSSQSGTDDERAYDADDEDSDPEYTEADRLLDRIRAGVVYTQQQHALGEPIMQTTRFQVDTSDLSSRPALNLLRHYGTRIALAPPFELFELGVPRPDWVAEGDLPGIHDPQWWVGKSQAEIKAGPHADEADVRRAAGHLKGLKTRQSKRKGLTAREKENQWKLDAAAKSQKRNATVQHHDEDESEEETEMEVDGGEYMSSSS